MLRHICCSAIPSPLLKTREGNVSEYDNCWTTTSAAFLFFVFYLRQWARDTIWNRLVLFIKTFARVPPTEGLRILSLSSLGDFSLPSAFRYCGYKPRVLRINMKTSSQPGDAFRCVGQQSVAAVFTPKTSSQSKAKGFLGLVWAVEL